MAENFFALTVKTSKMLLTISILDARCPLLWIKPLVCVNPWRSSIYIYKKKKVRPVDRWLHYSSDLCWLMEKTLMVMTPLCRAPQEFDYLDSTTELPTHPSLNLILALKTKWQIRSSGKEKKKAGIMSYSTKEHFVSCRFRP